MQGVEAEEFLSGMGIEGGAGKFTRRTFPLVPTTRMGGTRRAVLRLFQNPRIKDVTIKFTKWTSTQRSNISGTMIPPSIEGFLLVFMAATALSGDNAVAARVKVLSIFLGFCSLEARLSRSSGWSSTSGIRLHCSLRRRNLLEAIRGISLRSIQKVFLLWFSCPEERRRDRNRKEEEAHLRICDMEERAGDSSKWSGEGFH
ncbi:hypothetical protein KSP40_PGU010593 [Platanthera guangdongensis]|uniref:Uncharacterized protein n=1 Tax=Platanthera guangdongensis TaxID=2320717 RepID=A0ABR2M7H0_9ASPA